MGLVNNPKVVKCCPLVVAYNSKISKDIVIIFIITFTLITSYSTASGFQLETQPTFANVF